MPTDTMEATQVQPPSPLPPRAQTSPASKNDRRRTCCRTVAHPDAAVVQPERKDVADLQRLRRVVSCLWQGRRASDPASLGVHLRSKEARRPCLLYTSPS